ncbi:catalase family peroxidase [Caballeronia sp. LZ062]|uniref:catalase family peroxidase n=1 Tax=unclassified Caballeronia TaxID=2646786 RepID=UPI002861A14F|nr:MULTISPECIES: catalase family peroxidase [unclassified Caballeronia]MDR5857424.1 catalase family peroxidase [Caballeronia sp. LZ050]MDR5868975.1 catalase family peroxidase [Caballeronia sp. LZ062]
MRLLRNPRRNAPELTKLALIGASVLGISTAFAYVAGVGATHRLTSTKIVDTLQSVGGVHAGYRRNHAKGVCVEGWFDGNGNASSISRAEVFTRERTPVTGRFAIPGPNPFVSDSGNPVRSLALEFRLRDGEQWRTAMNSTPVFIVNSARGFYEQLIASRPNPGTGKPDPMKLAAFFAAHPETFPFRDWVKTHAPSSSFANAAYYSINAFRATDASGAVHFVRWSLVPDATYEPVSPSNATRHDFLDDELKGRLAHGAQRWHLILTVAQPGDITNDATKAWPEDRKQIDAGTLVINRETAQADGDCRDINFDPTVLPAGLSVSDDPLLAARSSAYSVSFNRRTQEEAQHEAH